ncbi:restriction endonuclease subunit S [Finegoldia magna]|uniref:restriction endonuclease subunit S n=1 Tax=Finegoldia magna TaxID=1260 RepID=UPI0029061C12|nr:restriction endonuclease subunit S [Finegoldia magna]MDU5508626.1 restriction endonuclease subunit S [Finegoldia magna]
MSRLEELIQKLCPNGVEYKEIKDIANVSIGEFVHKNKQNPNAEYPVFNGGITNTGFYDEFNRTANKIIISARGANAGFVNRVFSNFWSGNSCYTIDVTDCTIDWNFLYYWLKSKEQKLLGDQQRGGIPAVSKKQVERFITPVPPLEVQREIVRILDSFTLLTAELTAELTARKKQYEYYEHNLLFDDKYKRMKLSDLCTVNQGLQIPISKRLKEPRENCYRYITVQFLKNNEDEQYYIENPDKNVICKEDDILVTRTGSTGVIVYGVEGCFHNNFFKVTPNELIHKKYMYFLLRSKYMYKKMLTAASGGTVPDLPHKKFYALEVPVPTIDEQKHIVEMLEKFNELCNDISIGLPAEIEARQKQYEFYRDKLLSFKQL